MKSFLELFEPRPSDESSLVPLIEFMGKDSDALLQLRIFNLIADLSYIKPWLRDAEKRINWKDPAIRSPVFRYEKLLNSHHAQSFMVLMDGKQQVQLDLNLLRSSLGVLSLANRKEDATITYLYTAQHRKPRNFSWALEILAIYFFSFTARGHLFVSIPAQERETNADAISLGFSETGTPGELRSYELSKERFENRPMDIRWNT